jgi:hypothetical protein
LFWAARRGVRWPVKEGFSVSLPASFLSQAESHGCFSGVFHFYARAKVCLSPARPPEETLVVQCADCLTFKIGALQTLLPLGADGHWLAGEVSDHNRRQRGFAWSVSGFHSAGPGFWLAAAYYDYCGVFLLNGANSRLLGTDLDLLLLAFQTGVALASHPQMSDAGQYVTHEAYFDFSKPIGTVTNAQDLLASPQCRLRPARGYQRVTIAEFLPVALMAALSQIGATSPDPTDTEATPREALEIGDICPICKSEVRERPLFTGSYIGCLCD